MENILQLMEICNLIFYNLLFILCNFSFDGVFKNDILPYGVLTYADGKK